MGKILQKRKNRSSAPKVKHKSRKLKNGNKKINALGNQVVADNWYVASLLLYVCPRLIFGRCANTCVRACRNRKLTLAQNYRRLGLTARLNVPTGGVEKLAGTSVVTNATHVDPLHAHILSTSSSKRKNDKSLTLTPGEARVERDPETGKILRVIREGNEDEEMIEVGGRKIRAANPLGDPLEEIPKSGIEGVLMGAEGETDVVRELERQAALEEEAVKKKKPRTQSKREVEWLERLVGRYGEDTRAMARDRKLNPMQQTEADIARRLRKWRASQGQEE